MEKMNQAEKLKQLIELAWDNGWQGLSKLKEYKEKDEKFNVPKKFISFYIIIIDRQNEIIFDHEFIKALCRAKYKHDWEEDSHCAYGDKVTLCWSNYHLTRTVMEENRIDYLYEVFIDGK